MARENVPIMCVLDCEILCHQDLLPRAHRERTERRNAGRIYVGAPFRCHSFITATTTRRTRLEPSSLQVL
jgi:hypothetical protein